LRWSPPRSTVRAYGFRMLAWIDLEATGLIAAKHAILEVAAIVTDDRLQEVDRFHRVVYWEPAQLLAHLGANSTPDRFAEAATSMEMDPVVIELHARNGLWTEAASSPHSLTEVDEQFADFLARVSVGQDAQRAQIAGSSIWLDRSFMSVSLPRALAQLHYKCVDVTTLNELSRRFWPRLHQGLPGKREIHRAMPDIEDSLELCRYYAARVS
jgi:oligoribonuclease